MTEKIKKITSVLILLSLLSFYFIAPFTVKKADAILGIADQSFTFTIGDIPRYIGELAIKIASYGLERLRRRMLVQIQNDLVNWVQNGGEPRFIKDPGKFLKDNVDATAAKEIDKLFLSKNIDICSPFRANVRFLVSKPLLLKEESVRCSLGDMVDNLENFAQNFENGGWTAWLKLHETRNTLPGSYLAASELIGAKVARSGNTAQATLSAGKGFLDQKLCSEVKYPKYTVRFYRNTGDTTPYKFDVPVQEIGLFAEGIPNDWISVWNRITTEPYVNVDRDTIEFENTGEFKTITFNPPAKGMPQGALCVKEETVTPGSIIGDQISGVLEKTGIDNIINAKELAQILNAVIDAAVNRAAREGLSYMKSGRGSYTVPLTDRTAKQKNQDLSGLESAEAISFQNQLADLRNGSSKLKLDIKKLSGKTDKLTSFNQRLDFIAGKYEGSNYVESELLKKTIRGKGSDKKFSDVADRFFSKSNTALSWEDGPKDADGDAIAITLPPTDSNFNKEENMPGLYLANKAINTKLTDIWQAISAIFNDLSSATAYGTKNFCKEIQYILEPEVANGIDTLPFTNSDGVSIPWSSSDKSYVTRIEETVTTFISVDNTAGYMSISANDAVSKSEEYRQIADSYESLTENASSTILELESDGEFVRSQMPNIITYTSILMDYDRIGRNHNLVQKIKTHTELLGSKNKILRVPQPNGADEVLTGKEAEERAYNDLKDARTRTMSDWLAQAATAAAADSENINLQTKTNIIRDAKSLIESSLSPDTEEFISTNATGDPIITTREIIFRDTAGNPIINTSNLGIKTSDAVAEAMNLNIEALRSEMEERQQRLGRQQTDVSNRLGKFIEDSQLRKQASIEGGDSEWEKHFKNRMQLVYAAHIYDFYKNRLLADRGATADNFCRQNVPE